MTESTVAFDKIYYRPESNTLINLYAFESYRRANIESTLLEAGFVLIANNHEVPMHFNYNTWEWKVLTITNDEVDGYHLSWTVPNHRLKAKAAIHAEYDYDHANLDSIDNIISCQTLMAKAVHQSQPSDSVLAISMNKCVLELEIIKNRVTRRKRENEVIHALVGGDTTASSQALLSLSAETINATIKLVQQVSTDYGAAGLNLLELHFNNSLHFDADGNIVLPAAIEFEGANGTPTPEPTNEEE